VRRTDGLNGFSGGWEGYSMDVTEMIAELRAELQEIEEEISLLEQPDNGGGQPVAGPETVN